MVVGDGGAGGGCPALLVGQRYGSTGSKRFYCESVRGKGRFVVVVVVEAGGKPQER